MTYAQTAFTGETGARPITAASRRIMRDLERRVADAVAITDKAELYRVVEGAAVALGLGVGARETLRHLIGYARLEDWREDRSPVVWPSNLTLADKAHRTVGAIKARLRQLRQAGLILARDSAPGRRTGRRDDSGAISSAFGIDLSPIRIRFDELRAIADRYTAEVRLFNEGDRLIGRVRRLVGQALAQAAYLRLAGPHWLALQDAIEDVSARARAARSARDSAEYQAVIAALTGVEKLVGDTVDQFMFSDEITGSGSKNAPAIQIQTTPHPLDDVQAERACSSDPVGRASPPAVLPASPSSSRFKAEPSELVAMFPTTAMYVGARNPGWRDLHHAASRLRHDLGIRIDTYVDALDKLGADAAAIAVMITAERQTREEIRLTPGAYFAGMVGKAKRDELDLAKSLWGFRTKTSAMN